MSTIEDTQEEPVEREERPQRICPRCGRPFTYLERHIVRGNIYYYAVHEARENGRRVRDKHYVGPAEYVAGRATHAWLGVEWEGAVNPDPERLLEYLQRVLDAVMARADEMSPEVIEKVRAELGRALDELR